MTETKRHLHAARPIWNGCAGHLHALCMFLACASQCWTLLAPQRIGQHDLMHAAASSSALMPTACSLLLLLLLLLPLPCRGCA